MISELAVFVTQILLATRNLEPAQASRS